MSIGPVMLQMQKINGTQAVSFLNVILNVILSDFSPRKVMWT